MLTKIIAFCFFMLSSYGFYEDGLNICDREYWFISLGLMFGTILWNI